jgi:hypothetical protein
LRDERRQGEENSFGLFGFLSMRVKNRKEDPGPTLMERNFGDVGRRVTELQS